MDVYYNLSAENYFAEKMTFLAAHQADNMWLSVATANALAGRPCRGAAKRLPHQKGEGKNMGGSCWLEVPSWSVVAVHFPANGKTRGEGSRKEERLLGEKERWMRRTETEFKKRKMFCGPSCETPCVRDMLVDCNLPVGTCMPVILVQLGKTTRSNGSGS